MTRQAERLLMIGAGTIKLAHRFIDSSPRVVQTRQRGTRLPGGLDSAGIVRDGFHIGVTPGRALTCCREIPLGVGKRASLVKMMAENRSQFVQALRIKIFEYMAHCLMQSLTIFFQQ